MSNKTKIVISIAGAIICFIIAILLCELKIKSLENKVEFYEKVITDFGIEEFINYPGLYYEEGFIEQAKVHQCMWAIDDAVDCNNRLEDIKYQYGIAECPQDGYENCNN